MDIQSLFQFAISFISTAASIVTLRDACRPIIDKEFKSQSDWMLFCRRFKKYVKEHPELRISIVVSDKKNGITKYEFIGGEE